MYIIRLASSMGTIMAEVIALARREAPPRSGKKDFIRKGECQILLFTGVRYERLLDADEDKSARPAIQN